MDRRFLGVAFAVVCFLVMYFWSEPIVVWLNR
jgi:hypothetical protein